jgi:hypothetical protein
MNSASLCSLAGRYDNPIPPRFLAPIDFLKIPAQLVSNNLFLLKIFSVMNRSSRTTCYVTLSLMIKFMFRDWDPVPDALSLVECLQTIIYYEVYCTRTNV